MKYCFYCGAELEDSDVFCMECGKEQIFQKEKSTYTTQQSTSQKKFNNESNTSKIVAICIAIVILLLAFIFFYGVVKNDDFGAAPDNDYGYDDVYLGDDGYNEYAEDFMFYDSSSRYLTFGDVAYLDEDDCQQAINEIYAKHGRIFGDEPYASYFNSCEWYYPTYSGDEFDASVFNDYENENISLLSERRAELK